jgi:glycosyltransferase involved in cell wall biosynthesis
LYKGHDDLIRALTRLSGLNSDVRLILVGQGRYQGYLRSLACEMGVADRVEFTGFIDDREQLDRILDRAAIFALPSKTEGLPRALIEAMSRGLPCVASRVGGVPELLDSSMTFPPGDVEHLARLLGLLLDDRRLRDEQGLRNARTAAEYARSRMARARLSWREAVLELAASATGRVANVKRVGECGELQVARTPHGREGD